MIVVKTEMWISGKKLTSNHEEYSNDITLENLSTISVQIYGGFTYLSRKSNEETWGN